MALHMCDNGFYGIKILPKKGNPTNQLDENHLREVLAKYGEVKLLQMPNNNLAFAFYQEHEEARACLQDLRDSKDYLAAPGWPKQTTMDNKIKRTSTREAMTRNDPESVKEKEDGSHNPHANTKNQEESQNSQEEKTLNGNGTNYQVKSQTRNNENLPKQQKVYKKYRKNWEDDPLTKKLIAIMAEVNATNLEKENSRKAEEIVGEPRNVSNRESGRTLRSRSETRNDTKFVNDNNHSSRRNQSVDRSGIERKDHNGKLDIPVKVRANQEIKDDERRTTVNSSEIKRPTTIQRETSKNNNSNNSNKGPVENSFNYNKFSRRFQSVDRSGIGRRNYDNYKDLRREDDDYGYEKGKIEAKECERGRSMNRTAIRFPPRARSNSRWNDPKNDTSYTGHQVSKRNQSIDRTGVDRRNYGNYKREEDVNRERGRNEEPQELRRPHRSQSVSRSSNYDKNYNYRNPAISRGTHWNNDRQDFPRREPEVHCNDNRRQEAGVEDGRRQPLFRNESRITRGNRSTTSKAVIHYCWQLAIELEKSGCFTKLNQRKRPTYVVLLNLPENIFEQMVYDLCKAFTSVLSVNMTHPSRTTLPPHAFVFIETSKEAKDLKSCIDGRNLKGRKIQVITEEEIQLSKKKICHTVVA